MPRTSTLSFNLASATFNPDDYNTINAVWRALATKVGGNPDESVNFSVGDDGEDSDISGADAPVAGSAYVAMIKLGEKAV